MPRQLQFFQDLETQLFTALDTAERSGLACGVGEAAFHQAMMALDLLSQERISKIYDPLAADPLTRDYVLHLDDQLRGLASRIDIHRTRIELGLLQGEVTATVEASLARLVRQLKARFRREAALMPVYAGWRQRQPASLAAR
jgi:hypothetical protein